MEVRILQAKFASSLSPTQISEATATVTDPELKQLLNQIEIRLQWQVQDACKRIYTITADEFLNTSLRALKKLAELIRHLMKPQTWAVLEVQDHNGDTWGYLITKESIYRIDFLPMVRKNNTWIPLPEITQKLEAPYPI